jgi:hypothetical protein
MKRKKKKEGSRTNESRGTCSVPTCSQPVKLRYIGYDICGRCWYADQNGTMNLKEILGVKPNADPSCGNEKPTDPTDGTDEGED